MAKSFRMHSMKRTPRNFDGKECTTHHLGSILPSIMQKLEANYSDRPDLVVAAWPDIVGRNLSPMAQAKRFHEGVLFVEVKNSSLYALLTQRDKGKLLQILRQKFPSVEIQNIQFRLT
jgi:hypothetical protein